LTFATSMLNYAIIFLVVVWWLVLCLWVSLVAIVVIVIMCME